MSASSDDLSVEGLGSQRTVNIQKEVSIMKHRNYFNDLIYARRLSMEHEYLKERLRRMKDNREK